MKPNSSFLFFMLSKNLLLGLIALTASYILTPMAIPLCRITGALDRPDNIRKINTHPVPRLGGLAFFAASFIALLPLAQGSSAVLALLTSGALIAAGGVADDTFGLSAGVKLLIQLGAAIVSVTIMGMPDFLSFFGIIKIPLLGPIGFVFAVTRILFTVNAVNFSDGLDGLASGLSFVALISLSIFGAANMNPVPSAAAFVIALSLLGFIPYNRYRAKIFMGDCGSQFLGLAIAILSLANARENSFTLETALFLAVPTFDTAVSVFRRIIKGKSPFAADKGHLHHILLELGLPHPYAANLLIALSALIAVCTLFFAL